MSKCPYHLVLPGKKIKYVCGSPDNDSGKIQDTFPHELTKFYSKRTYTEDSNPTLEYKCFGKPEKMGKCPINYFNKKKSKSLEQHLSN